MKIILRKEKFNRSSPYTQDFGGKGFPSAFSVRIYLESILKKDDWIFVLFESKGRKPIEAITNYKKDHVYHQIPKCLLGSKFTTHTAARLSMLCRLIQKESGLNDNREVLAHMVKTILQNTGDGKEDIFKISYFPLSLNKNSEKIQNACKGESTSCLWKPNWAQIYQPILPIIDLSRSFRDQFTDPPIPNPPPKELEEAWRQSFKDPLWTLDEFLSYWENAGSGDFLLKELQEDLPKGNQDLPPSDASFSPNKAENSNALTADSSQYVRISEAKIPADVLKNSFFNSGNVWTIRFEGKEITLKEAKGLTCIAYLLQNQNKDIPVEQLSALCNPGLPTKPASINHNRSEEGMGEEPVADSPMGGIKNPHMDEVLDEKAIAEYKKRLKELEKEINEAELNNDRSTLEKLQFEKEFICGELEKTRKITGNSRQFSNTKEKIRKAVYGNIKNSLKAIKVQHPSLFKHLDNAIDTGLTCSYKPYPHTDWKL